MIVVRVDFSPLMSIKYAFLEVRFAEVTKESDNGLCKECPNGYVAVLSGSDVCKQCPQGYLYIKASQPCKSVDITVYSFSLR